MLRGWRERDEDRRCSKRGIGTEKDRRFFGQRGLPVAFGFPLAPVNLLLLFFPPLFLSLRQTLDRENLSFFPSLLVPPPPLSLCLPPFLPSLSPYFSLVSYLFPSFSLSFDFSLDFFENAAPIHHRCATIIMRNRCRSDRLKNRSFFQKPVRPRSLCEFYQILRSMIEHQPIVTGFRRTISLGISSLGMEIKWSRAKRWRDDRCCFGNSRDKILTTRMK